MKKTYLFSILAVIIIFSSMTAQQDNRLMLQGGTLLPSANLEQFIKNDRPQADEVFNGYYYRFLQFYTLPTDAEKSAISNSGIVLLDYIPHNAFIAAIPVNYTISNFRSFNIRSVIAQTPLQKINSKLVGTTPHYAIIENGFADVVVQYHKNISSYDARKVAGNAGVILKSFEINHSLTMRIPENSIQHLSQLPWVFYIDAVAPASTPDDTKGRNLHRSNVINSDYRMGRHYDGAGVAAALADDGEVGPHIDFTGRITNHLVGSGGSHGDMTSGILAGAGNLDPVIRGMATGVQLHVFSIGTYPQIIDAVANYNTLGTTISSTSYSQGCNEYTADSQFGDQTLHDNPQLEFVFSAGNNGSADCGYGAGAGWGNITGGYKSGKNVIAVANLSPLEVLDPTSSRGPAADGRIKPDISANGLDQMSTDQNNTYQLGGGTSAACPGLAGIFAQLTQAYKELNAAPEAPAALLKACLLNSAEDIGNAGPDYTYGWGRVNALRAVTTLEELRYSTSSISQGITNTSTIIVPVGVTEMRVMVYWHDQAGTPLASVSLVNDLDVTVTDPSAAVFQPWVLNPAPNASTLDLPAIRGNDHLNNVEQVTIDNPMAGSYIVSINGFAVPQGPQDYYLVYEFRTDDIAVTYPIGGEGFVPGEQEVIRWDGMKSSGPFSVEYTIDNGVNWITIATVPGNTLQYLWTVPNTVTGEARIRVSRGTATANSPEVFSIIGVPQNLVVDWACVDSLQLSWDPVPGAAWYEVSMLGAMYMDSIGISPYPHFVVTGVNPLTEYWFSCRALFPVKGRRAYAINKQPGILNCQFAFDVQLVNIVSPMAGSLQNCQDNSNIPVTVALFNNGINPVNGISVQYSLNGGPPVTSNFSGTLAPFASTNFSFPVSVDLSLPGTYTVNAWVNYAGDNNLYNDSATSVTIISQGGPASALPVIQNFESSTLCNTGSDCEATVCSLADGWINETNVDQDDIDFRVNEGPTISTSTGPDVDHTLGTTSGNYVYLEASNGCTGKKANLVSPCIDLANALAPQMTFWYHMYGANMGSLQVDIYSNNSWTNAVIPVISGDHANQWLQSVVDLTAYIGQIINIRFTGITGSDYTSDLALDDINISSATGINQPLSENNVFIAPNPSSGIFNLTIMDPTTEKLTIDVVDIHGRIISGTTTDVSGKYSSTIDLRNYAKGVYTIVVKGSCGVYRTKVLVM